MHVAIQQQKKHLTLPIPKKNASTVELQFNSMVEAFIPPLESGDCLTYSEFTRRYNAMPHLKKAELIEGVVYMSAAVRFIHGEPHAQVIIWLGLYQAMTPGLKLADNTSVYLDEDTEVQPDVLLRLAPHLGGRCKPTPEKYLNGPPELVVEIAASSASYDLHQKRAAYQKHGVQEYIVWRVYDQAIDWFVLENGQYHTLPINDEGIINSQIFPGLCLDVEAILAADMATVLIVLQEKMQSEAYKRFVKKLAVK